METKQAILSWLLDGDPSIRWQVMKDLQNLDESAYHAERLKLNSSGWCSQLLALQGENGLWNKSLYNGKWISTTYTLYLLKLCGLNPFDPQALLACDQIFTGGLYQGNQIRFSRNQTMEDLGVSGLVLSLCSYFGYQNDCLKDVASFLIDRQDEEGSWLPNDDESSRPYKYETTLIILEGLLQYRQRYQVGDPHIMRAESAGQEFLLAHHLYLDGDDAIKKDWTSFSFPSYWFYDVLTALEYFRAFRRNRDQRLQPGIELVVQKQDKTGNWQAGKKHAGKTYFDMEKSGQPSRWNTLRALRVLNWWKEY